MIPLLSQIRKVKSAIPTPQIWAAEPSDRDRYWQELRAGCKDEAAFTRMREIWQELQVKQELALQKSNEKFSKAFRSNPTAIMITALKDGRCIEVNDSFEQISGYSRAEVIGKTTRELQLWYHPSDRDRVRHLLTTEGSVRNLELEFRLKSGEIGIGLFSAEVMEFDGEACLIATTEDITESKRAEAKLKAALERDRLLGEVALRIRQSLDLSQILQTTVAEVRQLLKADRVFIGYRDGIDCGKVLAESVDPRYPSVIPWHCDNRKVREISELFAQTPALIYNNVWELEQEDEDRAFCEKYHVQACLLVPIWLGGEFYGVIVVHQCDSPRNWQKFEVDFLEKLANQVSIAIQQGQLYHQVCRLNCCLEQQVQERTLQLEQQLQEVQELSELKDFFLQAISHDLRTPIMGMLLILQNLIKTTPAHGSAIISLNTLERMRQSSERQLEMLNTLLDTHAIAAGANQFDLQLTNLSTLCQSTLNDLEPIFERNQTKVITAIPDSLPWIRGDAAQLRRVLENLITNALKHNPPGLDLLVTAQAQSQQILCAVIDNGLGIHQSDRLFERYGKVMRYSAGIGLGLYLCRQIIEAHGGKIWVESQLGQGASFYFTLPLEPS
ncbi:MAG: ATP-binding protein [Pseudanabaenaceae cyanobacterium bins.68]|nr:ATP-binding protein [Pseudanabaenaceae cyanobacterium bins.68]